MHAVNWRCRIRARRRATELLGKLAQELQVGQPPRLNYSMGVGYFGVDFVGFRARGADRPEVDGPASLRIAASSVGAIAATKMVVDVHLPWCAIQGGSAGL